MVVINKKSLKDWLTCFQVCFKMILTCSVLLVTERKQAGKETQIAFTNNCVRDSGAKFNSVWLYKTSQRFKGLKWMHKGNFWDNTAGSDFCLIYLHAVKVLSLKGMLFVGLVWIVVTQRKQMNLPVRTEISQASQACLRGWSVTMIDAFKIKHA